MAREAARVAAKVEVRAVRAAAGKAVAVEGVTAEEEEAMDTETRAMVAATRAVVAAAMAWVVEATVVEAKVDRGREGC